MQVFQVNPPFAYSDISAAVKEGFASDACTFGIGGLATFDETGRPLYSPSIIRDVAKAINTHHDVEALTKFNILIKGDKAVTQADHDIIMMNLSKMQPKLMIRMKKLPIA